MGPPNTLTATIIAIGSTKAHLHAPSVAVLMFFRFYLILYSRVTVLILKNHEEIFIINYYYPVNASNGIRLRSSPSCS